MSNRIIVLHREPHTIPLEGEGLKRLVKLVVDFYGEQEIEGIEALCQITNLAASDSKVLIEAEIADRAPRDRLDRAIWALLS